MKRNKIKPKYLSIINNCDKENNSIDNWALEKKIFKGVIPLIWILLMLIWGVIPVVILNILGIDIDSLSNSTTIFISFINDLVFISILIKVYYKELKRDFKNYFNKDFKKHFKEAISYWLIGLGVMVIANYVIAIIFNGQLTENEETVRSLIQVAPLYMVFQLIVYAPITEELIFRKSIRKVITNKYLFAIISGVVFGGLHVISSVTDFTSLLYLIPYCSLGITFGLLYVKSDNIFSTMMVHAIHNTLALIVYLTSL